MKHTTKTETCLETCALQHSSFICILNSQGFRPLIGSWPCAMFTHQQAKDTQSRQEAFSDVYGNVCTATFVLTGLRLWNVSFVLQLLWSDGIALHISHSWLCCLWMLCTGSQPKTFFHLGGVFCLRAGCCHKFPPPALADETEVSEADRERSSASCKLACYLLHQPHLVLGRNQCGECCPELPPTTQCFLCNILGSESTFLSSFNTQTTVHQIWLTFGARRTHIPELPPLPVSVLVPKVSICPIRFFFVIVCIDMEILIISVRMLLSLR